MIATKTATEDLNFSEPEILSHGKEPLHIGNVKKFKRAKSVLHPKRIIPHHHKAGLNPLVDAAASLFSVLGKLKQIKSYSRLNTKLQKEIVREIKSFQNAIGHAGYQSEYKIVCSYVICATFDDILSQIDWGTHEKWKNFSLLSNLNQDPHHHDKFFTIIERVIKDPELYIDLMELMYICLSMGYKGKYGSTENDLYQLEQITHHLYKHIRAYRGSFSKTLSPISAKALKSVEITPQKSYSSLFIFFVTACIIMSIFISLGYLMDIISNEAYNNIIQLEKPIANKVFKQ